MNASFASSRRAFFAKRLQRLRGMLFVGTLTATVLTLAGAAAIRLAEPSNRADLSLILVACAAGALAALAASGERRLRLFRRVLGTVAASLLLTYVLVAALRPPEVASVAQLLAVRKRTPPPAEEALNYVYRETTGGGLGAKLPSGGGWTSSPPTESTLEAVGNGMYVRVEATGFLRDDEGLDDVANRLLADLAEDAGSVFDRFGAAAAFGGRPAVVKEVEVRRNEDDSEQRALIVIDDGPGGVVVVWVGGSSDSVENWLERRAEANQPWLVPTLASATLDPERLASLRRADAAERALAAATAQKAIRPHKIPRPGRAGALEDLADKLSPRRDSAGR